MFKSIINSLVPQNLKETKVIKDAIDVFTDYIVEKSPIAMDIYNLYSDKNEVIMEELLKVFAANVYYTLKNNINNETLIQKLDQVYQKAGYKNFRDIIIDDNILNIINKEMLESFKLFQQMKGHKSSIEFMYNIIENMKFQQGVLEGEGYFNFYEGENPFEYHVEGSLIPELFEYFVKPLSHPVGWGYIYSRIYTLFFEDYFLCKPHYNISVFEVGCLNKDSNKKDNFLQNTGWLTHTDVNENNIPDKFYYANGSNVENVTRKGNFFDVLDIKSEINLIQDPEVVLVEDNLKNDKVKKHYIRIHFKSGEFLEYITNPRSLILYYGTSENPLNAKIKKNYNEFLGHCGLNFKYDQKIITTLVDRINFAIDFGFSNSVGTQAVVGAGNYFVSKTQKLGQKYIQDCGLTFKGSVNNNILLVSNYKNLYPYNFNERHRILERVEFSKNKLFVYCNISTLEDSQKPYIMLLNGIITELTESKTEISVPRFKKTDMIEFKITDANNEIHEHIEFRLREVKFDDQIITLNENVRYIFDNPFEYTNVVGNFKLMDQKLNANGNLMGNSGALIRDDFEIESIDVIPTDGIIKLSFDDNFEPPYDFAPEENTGYYQSLWGMQSGHVDVYDNHPFKFDDSFLVKDTIDIKAIIS